MEPYVEGRNVQSENTPTDLPQKYVNLILVVFAVGRRYTDLENKRLLAGINWAEDDQFCGVRFLHC